MIKEPEKFTEWLVTDLPLGHYEAKVRSLRHFGICAEALAHRIIATCAWALLCHLHDKPYVMLFILRELFESASDPKITSLPEKPDLSIDDLRERCRRLWLFLVLLLQYLEDAAFATEHGDYVGPLCLDYSLALFVKHCALFLFGGLNEITHSEIDRCMAWVSFGNLCHSPEEWDCMHEDTKEARKWGKVLQDNTLEAYQLEAWSEWDIVNLHMGVYQGFPCPRYNEEALPGDLKGKEHFPMPDNLPQITPKECKRNVAGCKQRKETIVSGEPLPPGVGGNPTTQLFDENDEKIHMMAFKKCCESRERRSRKTEAKVKLPTKTPASMERDEHRELLDYEDDLGEPPFDPMNDKLPLVATSWESELDGLLWM